MQPEEEKQPFPPQQTVQPEQPENWQQPAVPSVPEAFVSQTPELTVAPAEGTSEYENSAEQVESRPRQSEEYPAYEPTSAPVTDVDEGEVIRWQANEHIFREKNPIWYVIFAIVVLSLIAVALFLVRSWTFAILVPVMAAALVIYVRRPPALISYTLSRKGLHINDRLYAFDLYKEFGLIHDDDENAVLLVPRKRFQPGVTVYFPEEVGEAVVDMLVARLPMHEVKLDPIDRLIRRLHI